MSFLVLGLPRSRTAWLARFLSYREWYCGHEELRHMRSLEDVDTWFSQEATGSAETAAVPFWRLIPANVRIVLVRRPVGAVVDSLMALPGLEFDPDVLTREMTRLDRKLDQIAARRECLSISLDELNESGCKKVFEYCLPYQFDREHWEALAPVNVQCNMVALMRYMRAYLPALEKLGKVARHRILTRMAVREPVSADGMTIQAESFDAWLAGAGHLFDEHLVQVGEAPGDWQGKNIPLMRKLYDIGAMQIMTARSNGRMFGYRMSLIAPSLTSESVVSASNLTIFASPDAPGLGIKLERAALKALKERGVNEVVWECGSRGSGAKVSAIPRRLGAAEHGQTFRLQLTEH